MRDSINVSRLLIPDGGHDFCFSLNPLSSILGRLGKEGDTSPFKDLLFLSFYKNILTRVWQHRYIKEGARFRTPFLFGLQFAAGYFLFTPNKAPEDVFGRHAVASPEPAF
jgi:hypothetical protein